MYWGADILLSILMNYLNTLCRVCPLPVSLLPEKAGLHLREQSMPKLFSHRAIQTQALCAEAGESLSV